MDAAARLAPVAPAERIAALDVCRGVALLGIFLVNIQLFFQPFGTLLEIRPPANTGDAAVWWFVKIFCEGKFYPMFSMLFGMGLILQLERARAAGRPFAGTYLRRLLILAVFGICHIVLLWAGDILLVYSVAGLVLLCCSRLSPRALLIVMAVLLVIATLLSAAAGAMGMTAGEQGSKAESAAVTAPAEGQPRPPETQPTSAPEGAQPTETSPPKAAKREGEFWRTPFGRLIQGFESKTVEAPNSPVWMECETEGLRDGPFSQALLFRLLTYVSFVMFMMFGFAWHVLAMFMLGAALMKLGIFQPHRLLWHRRFAILSAAVGFPLMLLAVALPSLTKATWVMMVIAPLALIGAPLMTLGYIGVVTLVVASGRAGAVAVWIGRAGRMALTVYLCESLTATFLSYHWGLGWFGQVSGPGRMLIVLCVYSALVLFANVWLRMFPMGPMEWLWRAGTYARLRPLCPQPAAQQNPPPMV